jgi:hypothetical protein
MTRSKLTSSILSLAIAVPLLAAPITAIATPKHCPPGHAKKGWCEAGERNGRRDDRPRVEYRYIDDYDQYGLRRPREGYAMPCEMMSCS